MNYTTAGNEMLNAATIRRLANRPHNTNIVIVNKSNSNTMGVFSDYQKAVSAYHSATFPASIQVVADFIHGKID